MDICRFSHQYPVAELQLHVPEVYAIPNNDWLVVPLPGMSIFLHILYDNDVHNRFRLGSRGSDLTALHVSTDHCKRNIDKLYVATLT